ncbi:hypothetical protein DCMF_09865 [Candidatus Formimonas warabiya]|uniref:Uroporphyrinogen decarboxylase (URO-D) domain-containing protein n=2 Tax=Formimonas warabiya TaxID=1761012 RepID=A0A3G1KRD4_FORW1|nr:hypothetical protein DCMF_09865 [Candidatus Formimonas warabiya]
MVAMGQWDDDSQLCRPARRLVWGERNQMMTSEERLQTVIRLKQPDRIPCAPLMESYAGRYAGFSNYEYMFDYEKAEQSLAFLSQQYPQWDIRRSLYSQFYGPYQNSILFIKTKMPGIDIPADREFQSLEYEAVSRQDYHVILEAGYDYFYHRYLQRIHGCSEENIAAALRHRSDLIKREIADSRKRGQAFLYGGYVLAAPVVISLMRSFEQFVRDMFQVPDLLEKVLEKTTESVIREGIQDARDSGIFRTFIGLPRVCGQFLSRKFFDRFSWPYVKQLILALIQAEIVPVLHLDSDWSENIPYLLELPPGKIIVELDGDTDIFAAGRVLSGHSCLLGDVSPHLFVLGSPVRVKSYCRKLMKEVGRQGGFILGSGCTVPLSAKHENVQAFFQSVEEFGYYE